MTSVTNDAFSNKVSINMITNIARTLIMTLIGIMLIPYYIDQLGLAVYAIIPLATTITNYVIVLVDPLSTSFGRFMTLAVRANDTDKANQTFSTAVYGLSRIILVLIPICLAISLLSPYAFNVGPSAASDVQLLFIMVLLSALLLAFSSCFDSVFVAQNNVFITYLSKIIYQIIQVGIIVLLFFIESPSILYIGYAYVISSVAMISILIIGVKKTYPEIKFTTKNRDKDQLKQIMNLGAWVTIDQIGGMLYIQASLIICNLYLGADEQGSFSIVANVISMVVTASNTFAVVISPLSYRYYADGNYDEMVSNIKFFIKFLGTLMSLPVMFVMVFLPQVMETWIGPGYDDLYNMLYLMLTVQLSICLVRTISSIPLAFGKVKTLAIWTVMCGILNILLALILVNIMDDGKMGLAVAWSISMLTSRIIFLPTYVSKLLKIKRHTFYPPILRTYGIFLGLILIGIAVKTSYTLPTGWAPIIIAFGIMFVIYMFIMMKYSFNSEDKVRMKSFLPKRIQKYI